MGRPPADGDGQRAGDVRIERGGDVRFAAERGSGRGERARAEERGLPGLPDGFLCDTPHTTLRGQFIEAIRRHRPEIVFTWDPWAPFEGHPDHRAVAWAAMEAASFAHFPLYHPEHLAAGLEPWYVPETYFFAKSPTGLNRRWILPSAAAEDHRCVVTTARGAERATTRWRLRARVTPRVTESTPQLSRVHRPNDPGGAGSREGAG
jgi:hypothetical protein